MTKEPTLQVCVNVPLSRVSDLLCCALEGGSNYWYMIEKMVEPTAIKFRSDTAHKFKHLDYPLNQGGALLSAMATAKAKKRRAKPSGLTYQL